MITKVFPRTGIGMKRRIGQHNDHSRMHSLLKCCDERVLRSEALQNPVRRGGIGGWSTGAVTNGRPAHTLASFVRSLQDEDVVPQRTIAGDRQVTFDDDVAVLDENNSLAVRRGNHGYDAPVSLQSAGCFLPSSDASICLNSFSAYPARTIPG